MTIVRYERVDLSLQRESIFLPSYEASLIFAGPISSTLAFKSKKRIFDKKKKICLITSRFLLFSNVLVKGNAIFPALVVFVRNCVNLLS